MIFGLFAWWLYEVDGAERSLLRGIYRTEADLLPDYQAGTLRVRLHRVRQYLMRELQSLFGGTGAPK